MFARGRGKPSRSTPSTVQCQKCLQKDESLSTLSSTQERPYKSRPSRSQQLRNPKLVPKLTNDTPNPLEKKKGIADEELAKKEAERARKRELDERDDELIKSDAKRRRSVSSDSVSSISTSASASPPVRGSAGAQKGAQKGRRKRAVSFDFESEDQGPASDRSMSRSPPPTRHRRRQRSTSRDSRSPPPQGTRYHSYRSREDGRSDHRRMRSPSPERVAEARHAGGRDHHHETKPRDNRPPSRPPRERSLSPFSKRLALTQSLNTGAR